MPNSNTADIPIQISRFNSSYQEATGRQFDWERSGSEKLLKILECSKSLSEKIIREPLWADQIKSYTSLLIKNELESLVDNIDAGNLGEIKKLLRYFKYRHMINIISDSNSSVYDTLKLWSDLADIIINKAYHMIYDICAKRYGYPAEEFKDQTIPVTGCILALGKLGSQELNISSDIDIICIYSSDRGISSGGPFGKISNHQFFSKLVEILSMVLSEITEDGFVYRVDHDLRPEGKSGPLANSLEAIEHYYETFGQDWERLALIRLRPIAGDMKLGKSFLEYVNPFVYRRALSLADITHLKSLKQKIDNESKQTSHFHNVKLGKGGIRELEFLVQGFQQVFGGKIAEIQVTNTFEAINLLANHNLIHPHIAKLLLETYSYLRSLENMIQIYEDRQTHNIPHSFTEQYHLAKRLGISEQDPNKAVTLLLHNWNKHSTIVNKLFNSIFETNYERFELEEAINANIESCNNEEEKTDSLAWFKKRETKRLSRLDLDGKISTPNLFNKLTLVAEVTISAALNIAKDSLAKRYGTPVQKNGDKARYAVVAFGRFGSSEIDYGSDLDLCFLYSENGNTTGPEKITNAEFFTRLSQRIISLISVNSRYGRAYEIDSDLRPSGKQGSLVATLNTFLEHYQDSSDVWGKLALLKSRAIASDKEFIKHVNSSISNIAYNINIPLETLIKEIDHLVSKSTKETDIENENQFSFKTSRGSLFELNYIIQLLQIMSLKRSQDIRTQNSFYIINELTKTSTVDHETISQISEIYLFYRTVLSRLRLLTESSSDTLNFDSPHINSLASSLGFSENKTFVTKIIQYHKKTREIFTGLIDKKI